MAFLDLFQSLRFVRRQDSGRGIAPMAALVFLSLAIKSALAWTLGIYSPDSVLYIAAAHHFEAGAWSAGLAVYPLPTLSLLLAGLHRLFGSWPLAAYLCSVLPAALTVVPIYRLSADLFDRRAAFWSAAAFALSPYLNKFGAELIRDPLFLFCFAWSLASLGRFLLEGGSRRLLASLAWYGASLLFRIDGAFFFPIALLLLFGLAWAHPDRRRTFAAAAWVWAAVPLILIAALAWVFPDRWQAFTQGDFLGDRLHDLVTLRFLDRYRTIAEGLRTLEEQGSDWAVGLFPEAARHYLGVLYGLVLSEYFLRLLYVPFAVPLVRGLIRPSARRPAEWLLPATAIGFALVCTLYVVQEGWIAKRYLSLLVLPAAPYLGLGMTRLLAAGFRSPRLRPLAWLGCAAFFLLPSGATARLALDNADGTLRQAAQWLGEQAQWQNARIYSTDNRVLLYAGRMADIPTWKSHGDLKGPLRSINDSRKLVLVVVETEKRTFPETLAELDGFVQVRYFKGPRRRVMVVWRPEGSGREGNSDAGPFPPSGNSVGKDAGAAENR